MSSALPTSCTSPSLLTLPASYSSPLITLYPSHLASPSLTFTHPSSFASRPSPFNLYLISIYLLHHLPPSPVAVRPGPSILPLSFLLRHYHLTLLDPRPIFLHPLTVITSRIFSSSSCGSKFTSLYPSLLFSLKVSSISLPSLTSVTSVKPAMQRRLLFCLLSYPLPLGFPSSIINFLDIRHFLSFLLPPCLPVHQLPSLVPGRATNPCCVISTT